MVSASIQRILPEEKNLILGATGLLGAIIFKELSRVSETQGTRFNSGIQEGVELHQVDLRDLNELKGLITRVSPTRIINCVGLASVEECENRPEASWKLNTEIPWRLAQISSSHGMQLVHISTDHFMSRESNPRTESAIVWPVNNYGLSKIESEKLVKRYNPNALILRTNFFGHTVGSTRSLLDFALKTFSSQKQVMGFTDVYFSPVGASQIARFLLDPRSKEVSGVLNFASKEVITKFEFLRMVAKCRGLDQSTVIPASILDSELRVKRPNYLALDSTRLSHELGYSLPTLEAMLESEMETIA
jgi:dTDP-4-dehydrorhamnose reductase